MPKSPAERKAEQRARQAAAGEQKLELVLDSQELDMLAHNCAARRPGREPYEMAEYVALLIRKDSAVLEKEIAELQKRSCLKCRENLPINSCVCSGDSACWVTMGWHDLKLKSNGETDGGNAG